MKYKFAIFLFLFLAGCASTSKVVVMPSGEEVNCKKAPKIWWGERGQDPSKNDLWKCWDWILIRQ